VTLILGAGAVEWVLRVLIYSAADGNWESTQARS
jgi:hypothetical protein